MTDAIPKSIAVEELELQSPLETPRYRINSRPDAAHSLFFQYLFFNEKTRKSPVVPPQYRTDISSNRGIPMLRLAAFALAVSAFLPLIAQQAAQTPAPPPTPVACPALKDLHLPDTTILRAEQYAAGEFPVSPQATAEMAAGAKYLPALCRVVAQLKPTSDSDIKMELWLPSEHWNGRFRGQGNGGFAGEIAYQLMGLAVIDGYASAGTDTGHTANFLGASWAANHPEKIADFGYRAVHLMTLRSKDLIAAYYGAPVKKSYFGACSDGGREALMEAQRFPADYDGILAGAPAYNWTALVTNALHNAEAQLATPESYIPPSKLPAISNAVLAACDGAGKAQDGVADGVLTDPPACRFKPSELLCKDADSDACLTAPQLKTLEAFYAGTHAADGKLIFPGYAMGGEADPGGWAPWITGDSLGKSLAFGFASGYFANMVYPPAKGEGKSGFDIKTASIDKSYADANRITAHDLNATDPNLKPFFDRGGKLILYHGWNDAAISPFSTIDYYNHLVAATGKQAAEANVRLYLVPGMDHCSSGPGADSFGQFGWLPTRGPDDPKRDAYFALEQWTEGGIAPVEIIAAKYAGGPTSNEVKMTRPLCPYPQIAKYKGTGDTTEAASFTCTAPR
jgi:feruloyl esterase